MSRTRSSEDRDDRNQEHEDGEERQQRRAEQQQDKTTVHIRNLHPRTAEEDIKEAFSRFGEVVSCKVIRDPHSQESRCFGFATMRTPEEADDVIRELDVTSLDGRTISVQMARRTEPRQPTPGAYRGLKSQEELRMGRRDDFRGYPPRQEYLPPPYLNDRFSRPPPRYPPPYDYPPPPRIDRYIDSRGRPEPRGYERDSAYERGYERDRAYERDRGYEKDRSYERDRGYERDRDRGLERR